jgi:hypothetical protein
MYAHVGSIVDEHLQQAYTSVTVEIKNLHNNAIIIFSTI